MTRLKGRRQGQENEKPVEDGKNNKKKNSAKGRGSRSKKTLAASRKPKISADTMELLRTVTKTNRNKVSVESVPEDDLIRCLSTRKDMVGGFEHSN